MYNPDLIAANATLACLLEASAEKPGNVTPTSGFHDMDYEAFLASAAAIGPAISRAGERGVGETILDAIQATRQVTRANTNLGIVLLLAPLAKAAHQAQGSRLKAQGANRETIPDFSNALPDEQLRIANYEFRIPEGELREQVSTVLGSLTVADASSAYAAIRLAMPGGVQAKVEKHDLSEEPVVTLREAMAEAAGRDSIASEYATGYVITFDTGLPALQGALERGLKRREAIVQAYLEILAAVPDTLIARKNGHAVAEAVSQGAAQVLRAGGMFADEGRQAIAAFDADLREPGNRLNPGTTADLMAAVLFVALLDGREGHMTHHEDTKS